MYSFYFLCWTLNKSLFSQWWHISQFHIMQQFDYKQIRHNYMMLILKKIKKIIATLLWLSDHALHNPRVILFSVSRSLHDTVPQSYCTPAVTTLHHQMAENIHSGGILCFSDSFSITVIWIMKIIITDGEQNEWMDERPPQSVHVHLSEHRHHSVYLGRRWGCC